MLRLVIDKQINNEMKLRLECNSLSQRDVNFGSEKHRSERCEDTCRWLLEQESEFRNWYARYSSDNLWMTGHVGCGKSTLTTYFVDLILISKRNNHRNCFYYFFSAEPRSKLLSTALESLLYQIIVFHGPFLNPPQGFLDLYQTEKRSGEWTISQLGDAIVGVLEYLELENVYLVVDGLDEYQPQVVDSDPKAELKTFLTTIFTMHKRLPATKLKCLITSRPHLLANARDLDLMPRESYQSFPVPEKNIEDDIETFLASEKQKRIVSQEFYSQLPLTSPTRSQLDSIPDLIKKYAGTSFLIARLMMRKFNDPAHFDKPVAVDRLVAEIENFNPKDGNDALAKEYRRSLALIDKEDHSRFKRLFQWLVVSSAGRGLAVEEARAIIDFNDTAESIEEFERSLVGTNYRAATTIKRMGASLLRVSDDQRVEWYHASAQEFICEIPLPNTSTTTEEWWSFTKADAEVNVARQCLSYIMLLDTIELDFSERFHEILSDVGSESFKEVPGPSDSEDSQAPKPVDSSESIRERVASFVKEHPLLGYVVENGASHIRRCEKDFGSDLLWNLIKKPLGLITACRLQWYAHAKLVEYRSHYPKEPTWLHAFAYLGFTLFTEKVLQDENLNRRAEVIKDSKGKAVKRSEFTHLHLAAMSGHTAMIRLLSNRERQSPIEGKKDGVPTSLELALQFGHFETAKALVVTGLPVDVHNDGPIVLEIAVRFAARELIKHLVCELDIEINCKIPHHGSVLEEAALRGDASFVEFLLELGASANGSYGGDLYGHPLAAAAFNGFDQVIWVLKSVGRADINQKRGQYTTALEAAAVANRTETVKLLLELGAKRKHVNDTVLNERITVIEVEMARDKRSPDAGSMLPSSHPAPSALRLPTLRTKSSKASTRSRFSRRSLRSIREINASIEKARKEIRELTRKAQVNLLTHTAVGQGFFDTVSLASFTTAVWAVNRVALEWFADGGMAILYFALANGDSLAVDKLTTQMWLEAMLVPIRMDRVSALEIMLRRCLSQFETLIRAGTKESFEKALYLVQAGIEMFLAIAQDKNPVLLHLIADLWTEYFERIFDLDAQWFYFRERVVSKIDEYRANYMEIFNNGEYDQLERYTRAALSALQIALEKRRYAVVDRLTSIMLRALEEILTSFSKQTVALYGTIQLSSVGYQEDLIGRLLHAGSRLMYLSFIYEEVELGKREAWEEVWKRRKRYSRYAGIVIITSLANAFSISREAFDQLKDAFIRSTANDLGTNLHLTITRDDLYSAYQILFESANQQILKRYGVSTVTDPADILVIGAVEDAVDVLLKESRCFGNCSGRTKLI